MSNITVIGDGGWGSALALILNGNRHRVTVWGPDAVYIEELKTSGDNSRFLPGVPLPDTIVWTADEAQALNGAEGIVQHVGTIHADSQAKAEGLTVIGRDSDLLRVLVVFDGLERGEPKLYSLRIHP